MQQQTMEQIICLTCSFEGIDLHHTLLPEGTRWTEVLRLSDLHRLVLRLLGPAYEHCYLVAQESAR
jgi:hypothetical protein